MGMQRMKVEGGDDGEEEEDDEYDDDDDEGPDPEEEWKGLAEKQLCPPEERITPESFAEWKVKFEEEMIAAGVLKRNAVKAKTGKQIFMDTSQDEGAAAKSKPGDGDPKQEGVVYNAALFNELDDEDLDDLSDGED